LGKTYFAVRFYCVEDNNRQELNGKCNAVLPLNVVAIRHAARLSRAAITDAQADVGYEYALHRFHKIRNAAMIGIERYTPMTPAISPPTRTAKIAASGCSLSLPPMIRGELK
jgi:hypothetical protein